MKEAAAPKQEYDRFPPIPANAKGDCRRKYYIMRVVVRQVCSADNGFAGKPERKFLGLKKTSLIFYGGTPEQGAKRLQADCTL